MSEVNKNVNFEDISNFLEGRNPEKYLVNVELDKTQSEAVLIFNIPKELKESIVIPYRDPFWRTETKLMCKDPYRPFIWITEEAGKLITERCGSKDNRIWKMKKAGLDIKRLRTTNLEGFESEKVKNGYKYMLYATSPTPYKTILDFLYRLNINMYGEEYRGMFMACSPVEQYLIQSKKRLFKGFDDYNDLHKLTFDLETTGLNPQVDKVFAIGVKDNRGFEELIEVGGEEYDDEFSAIGRFFEIINELKPDIIHGYYSEAFDFDFLDVRCQILGGDINQLAKTLSPKSGFIRNNNGNLKLGGETEKYTQTLMYGYNIIDTIHAVRRAKAIDSSIQTTGLKYITTFCEFEKKNRVYIDGDKIGKYWSDTDDFAFNDSNGQYYKLTAEKELKEGYSVVNGKYIVERYLMDDLWETQMVDQRFNQANFLINKILPTTYPKVCTMGTAGIWKLIMMAWSFENGLAIPQLEEKQDFTGGLARLMSFGYVRNVVKFDFTSLYPTIELAHGIKTEKDISNVMSGMLKYVLDERIRFKDLMKTHNKKREKLEEELKVTTDEVEIKRLKKEIEHHNQQASECDKKQLPLKILANSFFGSFGAVNIFPWGDGDCAEETTCRGRQYLRLMIDFFSKRGFTPLVGDSVTYDTPVYIKHRNGDIEVKAISELYNETKEEDILNNGQLRDYSEKPYKILTRNGWKKINYVYRHKTDKQIHRIKTKDRMIDVTEDHSLFTENKIEVQPKNLKTGDHIEVFDLKLENSYDNMTTEKAWLIGLFVGDGSAMATERPQKYFSIKKNETVYHKGQRRSWKISNINLDILNKAMVILKNEYGVDAKIKDHRESSGVYNLKTENSVLSELFAETCYTNYRFKKIPVEILNANKTIQTAFLDGFMASDGYGNTLEETQSIGQKSQVTMAGLSLLLNNLGKNYRIKIRKDKENFVTFNLKNRHNAELNDHYSEQETYVVWTNTKIKNPNEFVYDVSTEDGTFIAGIGGITAHNTDGFNYQIPDDLTCEYTSNGNYFKNKAGKVYTGVDGVLAEFNDLYMVEPMGLGIDEILGATINFSKKNYVDLFPPDKKHPNGKMKKVGNTVKSSTLAIYQQEFFDKGLRLLCEGKGYEFINAYYDYIDDIYNYRIPLRKIASKSNVKQSMEDYIENCTKTNKAGNANARQAHMELAIKHDLIVNLGDSLYHYNIGEKKSHGDVKYDKVKNELIIRCNLLPNNVIDNEIDEFGEYNTSMYIDKFNKRLESLLICFHPDIRYDILIDNPEKRKHFLESQCELVYGIPSTKVNTQKHQTSYEEMMTPEDKEIRFWLRVNKRPNHEFVFNKPWDEIVEDFKEREKLRIEHEKFLEKRYFIEHLIEDKKEFGKRHEVKIPSKLKIQYNCNNEGFVSRKHGNKVASYEDYAAFYQMDFSEWLQYLNNYNTTDLYGAYIKIRDMKEDDIKQEKIKFLELITTKPEQVAKYARKRKFPTGFKKLFDLDETGENIISIKHGVKIASIEDYIRFYESEEAGEYLEETNDTGLYELYLDMLENKGEETESEEIIEAEE